ncbi:MAG: hypothetical protein DMF63_18660 [Acidobacteria bacterium]|nr:MAG: hypothetical protein DMF63_18660 [Acidobacteriota bacterium]
MPKVLLAFLTVLILAQFGGADPPFRQANKADQFLIKRWSTEDGIPQNTVTSIVQTRDGYIWIGTFGGLARFDGIRFTVFDSATVPILTGNRILSLFEDSHGTLWIGTETGEVYNLRNLKFEAIGTVAGFQRRTVWGFAEDTAGNLFISSGSGLERVALDASGAIVPASGKILTTAATDGLCKHPSGAVWIKVGSEYFAIEDDKLIPAADKGISLPIRTMRMTFADDGRAFVGSYTTLGIAEYGTYHEIVPIEAKIHQSGYSLGITDETFWYQQADELIEIRQGELIRHDLKGFVSGGSRAMLFDNDGNIWIATQYDGLVRLTRRKIGLASDLTDIEVAGIITTAEDRQGTVWLGGPQLFKVKNGSVTTLTDLERQGSFIRTMAVDSNDALWVSGTAGLFTLENDKLIQVSEPPLERRDVNSMYFDRVGNLWLGSNKGLNRRSPDGEYTNYSTENGLVDNDVRFITETRDGTLWLGTTHGVSKLKDGKFENISTEDGLPAAFVRDIYEDEDGTIWLGTYGGGIVRLRGGEMVAIRRSEGLPNNFVSRILVDNGGKFWILSNRGIFAVSRSELNEVADRKKGNLVGSIYGTADGMPSSEANGGHQLAGFKAANGKLWFPMLKDVVIIDPENSTHSRPGIEIELATSRSGSTDPVAPSELFDPSELLQIADDERNLEIEYTGLDFTRPEDLRFFYKLEGLENEWVDAGSRRTAFYPYLPAGDYTFQVKALNASGVWSERTATLRVNVEQRFWETRWFTSLAFAIVIGIGGFVFLARQRRQAERTEVQREFSRRLLYTHESERQRIATELHDGLGQNLLLIKNWASLANGEDPSSDDVSAYLGKISNTAAVSIEETRTIVRELIPQNLSLFGLTEAIMNMIDQIQDASGVVFDARVQNIDDLLSKESELSVYRIIQECLNNILKHSESSRGTIEVQKSEDFISIVIEDYGKGFPGNGETSETKKGIGLFSIAERVQFLGGTMAVDSVVGKGTKISFSIRIGDKQ